MTIIIVILTVIFLFFKVNAQEYVPYINNPIITKEISHHGYVQPYILKDQGHFSIWFADNDGARHRIVRMTSANGIDWYEKRDTKVSNRNNVHDPFVFFDQNEYILFFASSNFGNISLWRSTSLDGVTFITGQENEILKSEVPWEGSHVSCPSVIKDKDVYYLFYAGSGVSNWGIGLATSSDGKKWNRCSNNPIIAPGASAEIIVYKNKFFLYFQSPNGLEVQETNSLNGCLTVWTNRHIVKNSLRDPSLIVVDDNLWLYGTQSKSDGLHIGLSSNTEISPPKYPIIVIPGMFASWNGQAILHNEKVSPNQWTLQPGVKEYEALNGALKNKEYIENENLYLFSYDWRQSISKTIEDFDLFLNTNIWDTQPYQPVQLIGHSLGGTISRQYIQKNPLKPIKKIVTVGSPHYGALQAYKPIASGEIDRENTLMWLAEKIVLLLNKSKIESDKETVSKVLPVLNDLLPVFPYLKNNNGEFIQSVHKNELLTTQPFESTISQLYLGSSNSKIKAGYILDSRTLLETLENIYEDGHPREAWEEDGDGVILLKSTLNQSMPVSSLSHGETIFNKNNLKIILSALGIDIQENEIPIGKETQIFPAILAFIQSPATMKIESKNGVVNENQGMLWLQDAQNETYSLRVTGAEDGEYTLSIWLIGEDDDKWIQYKKMSKHMSDDVFIISFDEKIGGTVKEQKPPTVTPNPTPIQVLTKSSFTSVNLIEPTAFIVNNSQPLLSVKNSSTPTMQKFKTKKASFDQPAVLGVSNKKTQQLKINKYLVVCLILITSLIFVYAYKRNCIKNIYRKLVRRIKL